MKCKLNPHDYLKIVYKQAHKYKYKGIPFEDLVSIGNEALCKALLKYDSTQGDFLPFVWNAIRYDICAAFKEAARTERKRRPMTDAIIEGYSEVDETGFNKLYAAEQKAILHKALDQLPARLKYIIESRYLCTPSKTLETISAELYISKQRVAQLENDALIKLKALLPCNIL